jgi:hypothetical protein
MNISTSETRRGILSLALFAMTLLNTNGQSTTGNLTNHQANQYSDIAAHFRIDNHENSGVTSDCVATSQIDAALDSRNGYQDHTHQANEVTVVPEPKTAFLGLIGLALILRRRYC